MQGTVATYDELTRDGTVLLDDGTEVPFPGTAVAAGGLRLLRSGQRVRLIRRGDEITAVTLITMPAP